MDEQFNSPVNDGWDEAPETETEAGGPDFFVCPECFEQFGVPGGDVPEETREACETMKARFAGKKTDVDHLPAVVVLEDDEDESARYKIEVTVDEEGRISDVSRLMILRRRTVWTKGEEWFEEMPQPEDYGAGGTAERLIRGGIAVED